MPKQMYRCGSYKRLSKEDENNANISNSILNQDKMIKLYVESHDDLEIVASYVDDGVSGVGFDRPGFNQMIKDIDSGKIDCVIVKDLSRFGRNHYECDRYMQVIFPQKNIRFIAINDNYDSNNEVSDSDMFLIPIKNIINDNYCRDMSVKIRSQLETKRKMGECVKNFSPYGYVKDPDNKYQLVIDEYAAFIVREIFNMKLKGYSAQAIAKSLNDSGIKSPSEYKKSQGSNYSANLQRYSSAQWCASEVRNILADVTYCGALAQGKATKPTFKCKKTQPVSKDKWIVVENTHEAIISMPVFQAVERLLELETRISPSNDVVYSLSGVVRCGKCGGKMTRKVKSNKYGKYHYLICANKLKSTCDMPMVPYKGVEDAVLRTVQLHIETMVEVCDLISNWDLNKLLHSVNEILLSDLNEKKNEIKALENSIIFLHEKHISGVLANEEFSRLRKLKSAQLDKAEKELGILEKKWALSNGSFVKRNSWIESFQKYQNICELKREVVALFVKEIHIYADKRIDISFVYGAELDELLKLSSFLEKEQCAKMAQ